MKRILALISLLIFMAGCSPQASISEPQAQDPQPQITSLPQESCGDGTCDGPETADNCPEDCQAQPESENQAAAGVPPLYFFYAIHVHGTKEFLPYADPGKTSIDPVAAENMIAAVEGIAAVLDRYGAKATWEFLPATVEGLVEYQGQDNIFNSLQAGGHEIGVHAHKISDVSLAYQALQDFAGIKARTSSGFITQLSDSNASQAQDAMSFAVQVPVELGMSVGTVNLTPGGEMNILSSSCQDQFGVGNDMWEETGNLMFPWRPDYLQQDICSDQPGSGMVFVDHAPLTSFILPSESAPPDVLDSRHFLQLQLKFDAALGYMETNQPQRPAAWGFVTHIIEYALGGRAENPPETSALDALDGFLAHVDAQQKQGLVVYATASEIADLVTSQE